MAIHTLHVEAVMLLLVCTLLTVANSKLYRGLRGLQQFTLCNALGVLGAGFLALQGVIPDVVATVASGLLLLGASLCLFLSLHIIFGGDRKQTWVQYGLVGVGAIVLVLFGFVHPEAALRSIAYSLVLCLQQVHIALFLHQQENRTSRRVGGPLAIVLIALAGSNLVRMVVLALQGSALEAALAGEVLSYVAMIDLGLQIGVVVGFVWMMSGVERNDLQAKDSTDTLTGLLTRRALETMADEAIAAAMAAGKPVSIVTLDLDNFKSINDEFGHHRGDQTLIEVARIMLDKTRRYDLLARMGGDEFAMIMPGARLPEATAVANRIRLAIRTLQIGEENPSGVTVSFGIAQAAEGTTTWEQLSALCDKALYESKDQGGDRVTSEYVPLYDQASA
jgi:diguanylate cyclase (GGDEF)-like protein